MRGSGCHPYGVLGSMNNPIKPKGFYHTLILLDLPDGTRTSFFCDTPGELQMFGEVRVFESDLGWGDLDADQSRRPFPMDHLLICKHAAAFKGVSDKPIGGLPWVVHCDTTPDTSGQNLAKFTRSPLTAVPKEQENWREAYDEKGHHR